MLYWKSGVSCRCGKQALKILLNTSSDMWAMKYPIVCLKMCCWKILKRFIVVLEAQHTSRLHIYDLKINDHHDLTSRFGLSDFFLFFFRRRRIDAFVNTCRGHRKDALKFYHMLKQPLINSDHLERSNLIYNSGELEFVL